MDSRGNDNPNFCLEEKLSENDENSRNRNSDFEVTVNSKDDLKDPRIFSNDDSDASELIFEDKEYDGDCVGLGIEKFRSSITKLLSEHRSIVKPIFITRSVTLFYL